MRRRRINGNGIPRDLEMAALPQFKDDYSESVNARLGRFHDWERRFEEWRRRREIWSMTNEWPGGEEERIREEASYPYPDEPFDSNSI